MNDRIRLPRTLYRVTWEAGYGWPEVQYRRVTSRNFMTADGAGKQLAAIEQWPEHHVLLGVWQASDIEWTALDPASLPRPEEEDFGDDDG